MSEIHPVIDVTNWVRARDEAMGSKPKVWFRAPDERFWLFKYPRPNSGEHWSEKVAAEIAQELALPHAVVELAVCDGQVGALCLDFTEGGDIGNLFHANELLVELDPDYPTRQNFKLAKHTLDRIFDILDRNNVKTPRSWNGPPGIETSCELFVGYLLLDALIGNVDRHHENWGVVEFVDLGRTLIELELAPTFDHASSLGRELSDHQRIYKRGSGRADQTLAGYASRARSKIYASETDRKPMSPLGAYQAAALRYPDAAQIWRERLMAVAPAIFETCGIHVPPDIMSNEARSFAKALLKYNVGVILNLG